jgi:GTP-binding protein
MQSSTCFGCRILVRTRFHQRLLALQNGRRRLSSTRLSTQPVDGLSTYWETTAPTKNNLTAASHFFQHHRPYREWTDNQWVFTTDKNQKGRSAEVPEVVFLGRSNAGKSTLINALVLSDLNRVSQTPGMTEVMAAWGLAARDRDGGAIKGWDGDVFPKLTLVDMPGYGFGSKTEWGTKIVSYLNDRRTLRRAFLLVDSMHGIMASDFHMLEIFNKLGVSYQIVATKCDRLQSASNPIAVEEGLQRLQDQVRQKQSPLMLGEIIATSDLKDVGSSSRHLGPGVKNLQWAVLKAANLTDFAMRKAQEHKIVEAPAPAPKPQVTRTPPTITSSTQPQPHLSLEEFMREILGTNDKPKNSTPKLAPNIPKPEPRSLSAATAYEPVRPSSSPPPPKTDGVSSSAMSNARQRKSMSSGFDEFASMFDESSSSPLRFHATRKPSEVQSKLGAQSRASPPRPPRPPYSSPSPSRSLLSSLSSPPSSRLETRTSPNTSTSTLAGKGVSRGFDAFEQMFAAEDPKTATKVARGPRPAGQGTGKSARRRAKKAATKAADNAMPSVRSTGIQMPPAIVGKGVSRGLDAFESMFAETAPVKQKRRR